jgi:hypothetical protein
VVVGGSPAGRPLGVCLQRRQPARVPSPDLPTSAPAIQVDVYYIIATQDIARTAAISSYCNVEIEFDIYFWEPRKLTSS